MNQNINNTNQQRKTPNIIRQQISNRQLQTANNIRQTVNNNQIQTPNNTKQVLNNNPVQTVNNTKQVLNNKPVQTVNNTNKQVDINPKNALELDPNQFPIINNFCENLTGKLYVTNPAIEREEEIKKAMLVLLTPDKSALLIGKAGIGKTAIVEGIAYKIQRNEVPDALKGFRIYKVNSSTMLGKMTKDGKEETITNLLVSELKRAPKTILFIDEIHTLIGGSKDGPMDLANILKPALDRGDIKAIGATTTIEYETYIVRDRAFLRRFDRIDVLEPSHEATVQILLGTIPSIEYKTGIKMIQNVYIRKLLVNSIVTATSEYKRVYGLSAMYPDVSLSVLQASFSNALFENRKIVGIKDVYMAIRNSKRIYPDSRVKECKQFKEQYQRICMEEGIELPDVKLEDIDTLNEL